MVSSILKRPLSSRLRQRGSPETSKTRELDRGEIVFVFNVEEIVTLELAFSPTPEAVPRSPYRARYHSLSRLKEAYRWRLWKEHPAPDGGPVGHPKTLRSSLGL